MKKQTSIYIEEKTRTIIDKYCEEHKVKMSEAINEIIKKYDENIIVEKIMLKINKKYYNTLNSTKLSSRETERNTELILFAVNTILNSLKNVNLIDEEHKVIQRARELQKEKIAHFKQNRDNKKNKKVYNVDK